MKKKIISFISVLMIFIGASVAYATEANGFNDVFENDWYYTDIISSQKYGLVNGYEDGSFRPNDYVKYIEALKVSVLATMTLNNNNYSSWDSPYINTGLSYRAISSDFNNIKNTNITRYDYLRYIYKFLQSKYNLKNDSIENYFIDYNDEITTFMFEYGIINGVNSNGKISSKPWDFITRAETVVIANRVIELLQKTHFNRLFVNLPVEPYSKEEIDKVYKYMGFNHLTSLDIKYPLNIDYSSLGNVYSDEFNKVREEYYNYFQTYSSCSINIITDGKNIIFRIVLEDMPDGEKETISFFEKCEEINNKLWDDSLLTLNMTQYDMARVIFRYICQNYYYFQNDTDYILNQGNKMISNGYGICTGYTSIFNTLCNLNGIKAIGIGDTVNGELHMYSKCLLDGSVYYVDATWGDPVPDSPGNVNMKWFGVLESEILNIGRNIGGDIFEEFNFG